MVNSCLFALITFLSAHEHTAQNGWFFYDFQGPKEEYLVHTWVTEDTKVIKFVISKDSNLKIRPELKVLNKGLCMEKDLPYTYYEVSGYQE